MLSGGKLTRPILHVMRIVAMHASNVVTASNRKTRKDNLNVKEISRNLYLPVLVINIFLLLLLYYCEVMTQYYLATKEWKITYLLITSSVNIMPDENNLTPPTFCFRHCSSARALKTRHIIIRTSWLSGGFYALSASKAIFRARTYNCNLFSPVMMIAWWMKLGGNRPPGDNPLLFSTSGTGSYNDIEKTWCGQEARLPTNHRGLPSSHTP